MWTVAEVEEEEEVWMYVGMIFMQNKH